MEVARGAPLFGDTPFVFVVGDASEPLGTATVAAMNRVPEHEIRDMVAQRQQGNGNLPFGALLTVDDLGRILQARSGPAEVHVVVELLARYSTPPPDGYVHVLAIASGEVKATIVPIVPVCEACHHPLAKRDADRRCTWIGVPDGLPIIGMTDAMLARARELGTPMKCPCAGGISRFDARGRRLPN